MKAKHLLFVLFLVVQTFSISLFAGTDNISYSTLGLTDDNGYAEAFSNVVISSDARYTGALVVESGQLHFDGDGALLSLVSGGYMSSVTVYWGASATEDYDAVTIFASATSVSSLREVETLTYDGSSSQTFSSFNADDAYIALYTENEAYVDHIEIEWSTRVSYAITKVVDPSKGGITVASSAYAGDEVSVTVARTSSYAIVGYTVHQTAAPYEVVADVTHSPLTKSNTYEFEMPAYPVTIEAKYITAPATTLPATVQDAGGNSLTALNAMTSGETLTYYYEAPADYAGEVTVTSNNTSCAQAELVRTNAYSGQLIIHPYQVGSVKITLAFSADTKYKSRNFASKTATVSARNVVLVTELNDKCFAVTHDVEGSTTGAQELLKQGGNYYYKTGVDVSDITWQIENTDATHYHIKNGASYLSIDFSTMSLSGSSYTWGKDASRFITSALTGLCYNEGSTAFVVNNKDMYLSLSTLSPCVYEISTSSVSAATEYTRSLTSGNYATMCLPYPVSRSETFFSGVDVFNITGVFKTGETITGIELAEEEDALVAGKPYIIQATASSMSAWYGVETVLAPVSATGLVGNLNSTPVEVPVGCYGLASNQLRKVVYAGTATTKQYRAYINLDGVPEVGGASAPGRRVLYAENVGTSLEDFLENATEINWNEPVYNMLGQRVGKGTTGVLIQHGQKFLVK